MIYFIYKVLTLQTFKIPLWYGLSIQYINIELLSNFYKIKLINHLNMYYMSISDAL